MNQIKELTEKPLTRLNKKPCSTCQRWLPEIDLDSCEDCDQLICSACQVDYDNKLVFCQACHAT